MSQLVDDFLSSIVPKPAEYLFQEVKDDITDLRLNRKVQRNWFRLLASGTTSIFGALLPTVIAPDSVGLYLNQLVNALLPIENTAALYVCSSAICVSIIGSATLFGSKQIYRLLNKRLYGHTNSDYNFDEKRIAEIAEHYNKQYPNLNQELIKQNIRSICKYMVTQIAEKRDLDDMLSKNIKGYKKNPQHMEIISPKDPLSKSDLKLILTLFIHGDDRAFKAYLSLYAKVQTLYIQHYTKPALEMCELAKSIESFYPTITPQAHVHQTINYLRGVGHRENIVPSLPPLRPLFDVLHEDSSESEHDSPVRELEEISIYEHSDDEKREISATTNPLTFLEPYLREQTLQKHRLSFRPTVKPKINEDFAKELHHDIDEILEKMKKAVEQADHKKTRIEKLKRKTI
jgi:hypothetical protein